MDRRNFLLRGSTLAGGLAVPELVGRAMDATYPTPAAQAAAVDVKTGGT